MQWPKKITPFRLAAHDFKRSLQVWKGRISDVDILRSLVNERAKTMTMATRSLLFAVAGALWLNTSKTTTLVLKVQFFDLSVPASYVILVVALTLYTTTIHLVNYFALNALVSVASRVLFKFDAPWALTVSQDGGSAWSLGSLLQFRFFRSGRVHSKIGLVPAALLLLPSLGIVLFAYSTVLIYSWATIRHDQNFVNVILAALSIILTIFPVMHLALVLTSFDFEKNTTFIRWNFLFRLHRRAGGWPPMIGDWLTTSDPSLGDDNLPTPNPPSA